MEVSRTFHNHYSLEPNPADPRAKWARLDARLPYNGQDFTYEQVVDHLTTCVIDDDGNVGDPQAFQLIAEMAGVLMTNPRKSIRTTFLRLFQGTQGDYEESTVQTVYDAAILLSNLMEKKGPRQTDFYEALWGCPVKAEEVSGDYGVKPAEDDYPPAVPEEDRILVGRFARPSPRTPLWPVEDIDLDNDHATEPEPDPYDMGEPVPAEEEIDTVFERMGVSNRLQRVATAVPRRGSQRRVR